MALAMAAAQTLADPFPKEVGVDPVFKRRPRYRDARFKARCHKAVSSAGVISTSSVTAHKPHTQLLIIFFHDLVSTYFGGHLIQRC
jgi:hypothetical protein